PRIPDRQPRVSSSAKLPAFPRRGHVHCYRQDRSASPKAGSAPRETWWSETVVAVRSSWSLLDRRVSDADCVCCPAVNENTLADSTRSVEPQSCCHRRQTRRSHVA